MPDYFSFNLISHKLLKYLVPLFLTILFISNLFLLHAGNIYILFFIAQVIFYFLAVFDNKAKRFLYFEKYFTLARTFCMINIAIVVGWLQYFRGETYTTWSATR